MLISPTIDVRLKVESANTLRDSLDHYTSGPIYPAFLKKLVPIFVNILKGSPVFISTSGEQVCSISSSMMVFTDLLETPQYNTRNHTSTTLNSNRATGALRC